MDLKGMAVERIAFSQRETVTAFIGISLAMLMAVMDMAVIPTALPTMGASLDGMEYAAWVMTAYMLTTTATAPVYGKLSDLFGRRRVLEAAIVIFLAGAVLCAISTNIIQLILSRVLQGVGGGGLMVLAFITIGDIVPPRDQGRYQGYISAVFALASIVGPVSGGLLVEWVSWRCIFVLYIPIGLAALLLCRRSLQRLGQGRDKPRIDVVGAILLMAGITVLLLFLNALSSVRTGAFAFSPGLVALGVGTVVLFLLLLVQERRAPEPMIPLTLFRMPVFAVSVSVVALSSMAMFAATVFLPQYFQLVLGVGPTVSGLLLAPLQLGMMVGPIAGGWFAARTGRYKGCLLVALAIALAMFGVLGLFERIMSQVVVAPIILVVLGFGLGIVMPLLTVAVQGAVGSHDMGSATAALGFFRSLGGLIGVAMFGALYSVSVLGRLQAVPLADISTQSLIEGGRTALVGLPEETLQQVLGAFSGAFSAVLLAAAVLSAAALVVALFLEDRNLADQ